MALSIIVAYLLCGLLGSALARSVKNVKYFKLPVMPAVPPTYGPSSPLSAQDPNYPPASPFMPEEYDWSHYMPAEPPAPASVSTPVATDDKFYSKTEVYLLGLLFVLLMFIMIGAAFVLGLRWEDICRNLHPKENISITPVTPPSGDA